MHNLIVGVDPGTTIGVSILDIQTGKVKFWSKRNLGINKLVQALVKEGFVLAVGSDKLPAPINVVKLSSLLGAKLITPKKNLLEEEKVKLASTFDYGNPHERDAISAMLTAYKKLKPLLKKIDNAFENNKNLKRETYEAVVQRIVFSGVSVKEAFEIVKPKPKLINEKGGTLKAGQDKKQDKADLLKVKSLEKQMKILLNENRKLKHKLEISREKNKALTLMLAKASDTSEKSILEELKRENEFLKSQISNAEKNLLNFKQKIDTALSDAGEFVAVPKLKNLSSKKAVDTISSARFKHLFIDNPNEIYSKKDSIRNDYIKVILYNKNPNRNVKKLFNAYFVNINSVKVLFETDNFLIIKSEDLKIKPKTKLDFEKIVKEYRQRRC